MRELMKKPSTIAMLAKSLNMQNYERLYSAINHLKKFGLIKIKSYQFTSTYNKTAIFVPTIKSINVMVAKETSITTDTKLLVHIPNTDTNKDD